MKHTLILLAALTLAACSSAQSLNEGERLNWRCAGDKAFSLRYAAGAAEVYASGQTYSLPPVSEGRYSNGTVEYVESGGNATLTGAYGGPYENCHRRGLVGLLPRVW